MSRISHCFPTCIWLRCTRPALLSGIRYGQRIIKRAHATATQEETIMLRHMAADASNTISILLADLTAEYTSSSPLRRHLIADTNTIAEHATTQLASIANPPKKQS